MKTETLRLFVDVMRAGGFAAAARRANADPSAVSRAIAALERELDVRLFERSTRRFAPTEAGRAYFAAIAPLVEELERAAVRAHDVTARPAGTLRVAASVAFGCEVLAPRLGGFRARYPELAVELALSDAPADLVAERLDLAVRLGPPPQGGMVRTRLIPVAHRVCASPGWVKKRPPLTAPADLAGHDCVLFPFPGFAERWRFRDAVGTVDEVPVAGRVVISSALALKRCVLDGLGPGLLADWMIGDELAAGTLVDVFPRHAVTATSFDTAAWLLYPSPDYVPLKVRAFVDYLRGTFATADAAATTRSAS